MTKRLTTQAFIEASQRAYGDKYDYSQVVYTKALSKVIINCPTHGAFTQAPAYHLSGNGCPACGVASRAAKRLSDTQTFISKARAVHGDRYSYDDVVYTHTDAKVSIMCYTHGAFTQTPKDHLHGRGCPSCGRASTTAKQSGTGSEFIRKARAVHGDKYDYSQVVYTKALSKVIINCPTHGAFTQAPAYHLSGNGCPACGREAATAACTDTYDGFVSKARAIHGDKYDYTHTDYQKSQTKAVITCRKHGNFLQRPNCHLDGHGCPTCGTHASNAEQDIADLFISHGYDVIQRYRPDFMGRKELDVFVPALKLAVEYCGAHVHNADCNVLGGAPKAKTYHYDKWRVCRDNGITLITIFDFQWLHNREKVEAMLLHKMRRVTQRVYARKCELVELDRQTCWDFVKAHHIEGTGSWKLNCTYKGLRHGGELVAVMVVQDGDVKRSCTLAGVSVVGGVSRLFKAFPAGTTMMTTNDTGSSGTYGTKLEKYTLRYWWVKPNTSEYYTRYQCMKHKLESRFGTPVGDMTEAEYMLNMGYVRVYDSGLSYWVST